MYLNQQLLFPLSWVQSLSRVQLFATLRTATCQASLSITNSWSCSNSCPLSRWCLPTIASSVIPFSCLQSFPASGSFPILSVMSVLHIRWPEGWSFSFSISPSKEYSGLISFRMDWLNLLAVQGITSPSPSPRVFSSTTVQKHQFFGTQLSL